MFGLFKKETEKEKLEKQDNTISKEAYRLYSINRRIFYKKFYEA